jgi:hypothetical protein
MPTREVTFTVAHTRLLRGVCRGSGREYTHACT